MTIIQDTLRLFGITRCYKGFLHTAYAIYLAVQDESRLEAVTKEIYMATASRFHCRWTAVERNIRTAVARAWKINPPNRNLEVVRTSPDAVARAMPRAHAQDGQCGAPVGR